MNEVIAKFSIREGQVFLPLDGVKEHPFDVQTSPNGDTTIAEVLGSNTTLVFLCDDEGNYKVLIVEYHPDDMSSFEEFVGGLNIEGL